MTCCSTSSSAAWRGRTTTRGSSTTGGSTALRVEKHTAGRAGCSRHTRPPTSGPVSHALITARVSTPPCHRHQPTNHTGTQRLSPPTWALRLMPTSTSSLCTTLWASRRTRTSSCWQTPRTRSGCSAQRSQTTAGARGVTQALADCLLACLWDAALTQFSGTLLGTTTPPTLYTPAKVPADLCLGRLPAPEPTLLPRPGDSAQAR
jgi:hypothetical protein